MLRGRVVALGLASTAIVMCGSGRMRSRRRWQPPSRLPPRRSRHRPGRHPYRSDRPRPAAAPRHAPPARTPTRTAAALAAFYTGRVYAPVWVDTSGLNAKATAAIAEIGKAGDWGLDAKRVHASRARRASGARPRRAGRARAHAVARGAQVRKPCARRPHHGPCERSQLIPRPQAATARPGRRHDAHRRVGRSRRLPARTAPAASPVRKAAPAVPELAPGSEGRRGGKSASRAAAHAGQIRPAHRYSAQAPEDRAPPAPTPPPRPCTTTR